MMSELQMTNSKESCSAWYGWIKDCSIKQDSTSGGVFSAMAEYVLGRGGMVIGAHFDAQSKTVKHGSSDEIPIECFRKSKYVESDMSDSLSMIDTALTDNREVLFCGTPCQCAGVRKLFGYNSKLMLCDFFCHGVPSAKIFKDFLELKEKKAGKKLADYQFRTKDFGWSQYGIRTVYEDGQIDKTVGRCEFFYTATMLDDGFLRKSCYTCDKSMYHFSDFTIGDFWGINNVDPQKNDNTGISILIANTKYGKNIVEQLQGLLELFPLEKHNLDYAFKVKTSDKKIEGRNIKFDEYKKVGINTFIKKYYKRRLFFSKVMFMLKRKKLASGE